MSCWGWSLRQLHFLVEDDDEFWSLLLLLLLLLLVLLRVFSSLSMIIRPWPGGRRSKLIILQPHSLFLFLLFLLTSISCGDSGASLPFAVEAAAPRVVNDNDVAMNSSIVY